jgi:hypothetical protein
MGLEKHDVVCRDIGGRYVVHVVYYPAGDLDEKRDDMA